MFLPRELSRPFLSPGKAFKHDQGFYMGADLQNLNGTVVIEGFGNRQ